MKEKLLAREMINKQKINYFFSQFVFANKNVNNTV